MCMMIQENIHSITMQKGIDEDSYKTSFRKWFEIVNDFEVEHELKDDDVLNWIFGFVKWDDSSKYTFYIASDEKGYVVDTTTGAFDDYMEGLQKIYEAAEEWEQIKKEDLRQAELALEELKKKAA